MARVYDYFLGGSSNFSIDREFAREVLDVFPGAREFARLNRLFLQRVVRFLVAQGIQQFLDLGSGIPTVGAVHEVAQEIAPESRVVYVDLEPLALAYTRFLLEGNENATIVQGDICDPDELMRSPEVGEMLDLDEPVGVLMLAMLHFVPDDDDPARLLDRYHDLIAPGSFLAVSHTTDDDLPEITEAGKLYKRTTNPATVRSKEQLAALLKGFDLVEPGIVYTPEWRPETSDDVGEHPERSGTYAAVGCKTTLMTHR